MVFSSEFWEIFRNNFFVTFLANVSIIEKILGHKMETLVRDWSAEHLWLPCFKTRTKQKPRLFPIFL